MHIDEKYEKVIFTFYMNVLKRCANASAMCSNLCKVLDTTVVQRRLIFCVTVLNWSLARE